VERGQEFGRSDHEADAEAGGHALGGVRCPRRGSRRRRPR
jgi:hypothetical protein